MTRRRGRRSRWLDRLAEFVQREREAFPSVLWAALMDASIAERETRRQARLPLRDGRKASEMALRCCRLALMLLEGTEQQVAAKALGVTARTAKRDAQRLRRVVESGALAMPPDARRTARVPRRPGDRVAMPPARPPGRRR